MGCEEQYLWHKRGLLGVDDLLLWEWRDRQVMGATLAGPLQSLTEAVLRGRGTHKCRCTHVILCCTTGKKITGFSDVSA